MNPLGDHKEMDGISAEEQACRAINHVLRRIRDDSRIGYYMGVCSESFDLLTEAFATLKQLPVEQVRKSYAPRNARNPAKDEGGEG